MAISPRAACIMLPCVCAGEMQSAVPARAMEDLFLGPEALPGGELKVKCSLITHGGQGTVSSGISSLPHSTAFFI